MPSSETDYAERPSRVPWPPILLVGIMAVAVFLGWLNPLGWPGLDDAPARFVGFALGAAGIGLLIYSIVTLRRHDTTVLPDKGARALVTSGPYARFRNPIYLSDCLIMLGLAEATKNIWFVFGAALFAVLVTWLAILPEERHLEEKFGEDYLDYKANTRRWL